MPAVAFADPAGNWATSCTAHGSRIFHLWNVKRVRPASDVALRYAAEKYTPLLWWSEGVTDYLRRYHEPPIGLWTAEAFLHNAITDIQQWSSPEPWSERRQCRDLDRRGLCQQLAALLPQGRPHRHAPRHFDRDATDNVHSLDDFMRALTPLLQRGKGFTTENLLSLLREFGMPDVDGFYQRYINGGIRFPTGGVPESRNSPSQRRHERPVSLASWPPLSDRGKWVVQLSRPGSARMQRASRRGTSW